MSAKSIRAFQNAYPQHAPTPAQVARDCAAKLRRYAEGILARAAELEESADKLEGK